MIIHNEWTACTSSSPILLEGHVCGGLQEPEEALSIAMRHANNLLAKLDFTIRGAIDQASSMF